MNIMAEFTASQETVSQEIAPFPVIFTDSAAHKVKELILEEENLNLKLRVFITGGGCSGFQYGFAFEEQSNIDDMLIEKQVDDEKAGLVTVSVLIDPISMNYLVGAEIDYQEDINGSQFVIRNPNAQTTCGCGSSFNI